MRAQRAGRAPAPADRRVDVVHDRRGVGGDEVGHLGGVHARPAADRDEAVDLVLEREVGRRLKGLERRLDARASEHHDLDALGGDQALDPLRVPERGDAGVGDEHRPRDPEPAQLPAGVGAGARPELHRRRLHGEDRLALGGHVQSLAYPRAWPGKLGAGAAAPGDPQTSWLAEAQFELGVGLLGGEQLARLPRRGHPRLDGLPFTPSCPSRTSWPTSSAPPTS